VHDVAFDGDRCRSVSSHAVRNDALEDRVVDAPAESATVDRLVALGGGASGPRPDAGEHVGLRLPSESMAEPRTEPALGSGPPMPSEAVAAATAPRRCSTLSERVSCASISMRRSALALYLVPRGSYVLFSRVHSASMALHSSRRASYSF